MNDEHPAGDMDYYQFDATANVIKTDHTPALRFRVGITAPDPCEIHTRFDRRDDLLFCQPMFKGPWVDAYSHTYSLQNVIRTVNITSD